jgi:hypothetical protein
MFPKCGRCLKAVDSVTAEELPSGAVKVIYGCHGETKSYDIEKWYYDELVREKKPINSVEFTPAPVAVTMKPIADQKDIRIAELEVEVARLNEELKNNAISTISEQQSATTAAGGSAEQEHAARPSRRKST